MQNTIYEDDLVGISITVPEVRISPNLRNVIAFVFPLAGQAPKGFLNTLNRIAPQITSVIKAY